MHLQLKLPSILHRKTALIILLENVFCKRTIPAPSLPAVFVRGRDCPLFLLFPKAIPLPLFRFYAQALISQVYLCTFS